MIHPANLHSNDALQCLEHRTGAKPIHRVRPFRPFAQCNMIPSSRALCYQSMLLVVYFDWRAKLHGRAVAGLSVPLSVTPR